MFAWFFVLFSFPPLSSAEHDAFDFDDSGFKNNHKLDL